LLALKARKFMTFWRTPSGAESRLAIVGEAVGVTSIVTGLVVAAARLVPEGWVATVVGFLFLGATWLFVWRRDDGWVSDRGLALGGLVLPSEPRPRVWLRAGLHALGLAMLLALVTFVPFYLGFRRWIALQDSHLWGPELPKTLQDWRDALGRIQAAMTQGGIPFQRTFVFPFTPRALAERVLGQLVLVALPEEAFYRGYLQSRLADAFPMRRRLFGAPVGFAIVLTSALFAVGHLATIPAPARLAVFFPSLLFGWLRSRTKGIGAGLAYHASCNIFSELLFRGYMH
jgi:hypothetical protein